MGAVEPDPTFTAEGLIALARDRLGEAVTPRLIVDWVQRGLIDQPRRTSRGEGGGSLPGTWPAEQAALFLWALHQRRGVKRLATLCSLPVYAWLYHGDDSVPVRQVCRAMRTWTGAYRRAKKRGAYHSARVVAAQLSATSSTRRDRKELIDAIADAAMRGRMDDALRERIRIAARAVFLPLDVPIDSAQPAVVDPDAWADMVEGRLAVIDDLRRKRPLDFAWARQLHRATHAEYVDGYPDRVPRIAARFPAPSEAETAQYACSTLLTLLGLIEMARRQDHPNPGARLFDRDRSPLSRSAEGGTARATM